MLNKNKRKKFVERNKGVINRVVRTRLAKTRRVVHGTRASNAQLPKFLKRDTQDWDIFAKNPRRAAMRMEMALDRKFRGDFFEVKRGKTKALKVHKVFSKDTGESFVDFSVPDRKVMSKSIQGIRFASLKDQVERAKQNLRKSTAEFRREKDLDLLRRIKLSKKFIGGR